MCDEFISVWGEVSLVHNQVLVSCGDSVNLYNFNLSQGKNYVDKGICKNFIFTFTFYLYLQKH